jgi:hypothetical protein
LAENSFFRPQIAWALVFEGALRLSAVYSRQLGTPTLDLLHVAAASLLRASEFITSDQRQSDLAKREGLKVVMILYRDQGRLSRRDSVGRLDHVGVFSRPTFFKKVLQRFVSGV